MTESLKLRPPDYWRPAPGMVSPDRVAIAGRLGFLDLFEGGNLYYQGYLGPHNRDASMVAVNTITNLRAALMPALRGLLYAVVPSKASCLPENYPLLLPSAPTSVFREVRDYLEPISGHVFFNAMTMSDLGERQRRWMQTDSHWSAYGAWQAAAELLAVLGVPAPAVRTRYTEHEWGGDLCGRWSMDSPIAWEDREVLLGHDGERVVKHDNGNGLVHAVNNGRFVHWFNPAAPVKAKLVIVGGSSSGTGYFPEQLTYWLSMVFADTCFLHSANCPTDLIEELVPDFLLVQTNERFMQFPYLEKLTLQALLQSFTDRLAAIQP
ncbi:MAG: hypothetical protein ACREWI_16485 [Telluria sp.]